MVRTRQVAIIFVALAGYTVEGKGEGVQVVAIISSRMPEYHAIEGTQPREKLNYQEQLGVFGREDKDYIRVGKEKDEKPSWGILERDVTYGISIENVGETALIVYVYSHVKDDWIRELTIETRPTRGLFGPGVREVKVWRQKAIRIKPGGTETFPVPGNRTFEVHTRSVSGGFVQKTQVDVSAGVVVNVDDGDA